MIYIIILTLFFPVITALDCIDIKEGSICSTLNGCTWKQNQCIGQFTPDCDIPNCYYVDPIKGSDFSSNGSSLTPLRTLTAAFQELQGKNGNIVIINYGSKVEVEILSYTLVNSTISVRYRYICKESTLYKIGLCLMLISIS